MRGDAGLTSEGEIRRVAIARYPLSAELTLSRRVPGSCRSCSSLI